MVRDIEILYMLGHVVGGDTTFSCKEHSHLMHVLCIVFHVGKVPSPSGNLDTGNVEIDTEMHGPGDQAFSLAAIPTTKLTQLITFLNINYYTE